MVALVPETFWREGDVGSPEDREVEGIPILFGERCRLEYKGVDRYGISHARIRFRVVPKAKEGEDAVTLDPEQFLSDYGLRSMSKGLKDEPYRYDGAVVTYEPGESGRASSAAG